MKGAGHSPSSEYELMRQRRGRFSHSQRLEALDADFKQLVDMTVEAKIRKAVMNDIVRAISQGEDIVSHVSCSPMRAFFVPLSTRFPSFL